MILAPKVAPSNPKLPVSDDWLTVHIAYVNRTEAALEQARKNRPRTKTIRDYPTEGFLRFPLALLQCKHKFSAIKALAALMQVPEIRQSGATSKRQKAIAHYGCLPLKTFTTGLKECKALGWVTGSEGTLTVVPEIREKFSQEYNGHHLQVWKKWFTEFPELNIGDFLLYAYYRFRSNEFQNHCTDDFKEISGQIGSNERTWRRAAKRLTSAGLIQRNQMRRKNYSVTGPDNSARFPQRLPDWQEGKAICESHREAVGVFGWKVAATRISDGDILHASDLYRAFNGYVKPAVFWIMEVLEQQQGSPEPPTMFDLGRSWNSLSDAERQAAWTRAVSYMNAETDAIGAPPQPDKSAFEQGPQPDKSAFSSDFNRTNRRL